MNRLAVGIGAASIVAAAALSMLLSWQPNREALRGFESKAQSVSGMIAQLVSSAVEFEDKVAAQKDLDTASTDRSIVYLAVRAANGNLLAATHRDLVPNTPTLFAEHDVSVTLDNVYHFVTPVRSTGRSIGWLQAGFSLDEVKQRTAGTRLISLAVAVGVALLGLAIAVFTGRWLSVRQRLMGDIATTAEQLRVASRNIQDAANEQAASTEQQSAVVHETRQTMISLLEAARRIADASQEVFQNADQASSTSRELSEAIRLLTGQAQKISDISETIRSISDKSDLLALNASLEGSKAGEAGRGFALIAGEMRRLSETVMGAAREIKQLTVAIHSASDSSVKAADQGRMLAGKTSESAREITLVTGQQKIATEAVTKSMDEVGTLLGRTNENTRATDAAAQALSKLADELGHLTARASRRNGVPE